MTRYIDVVAKPPTVRSKYDPHRTALPVADRFWPKVRKSSDPDGCWEWTASRFRRAGGVLSYGNFLTGSRRDGTNRNMYAHRVSWELTYGPLPIGGLVLHKCDNPACVRPDHLFLGDHKANMVDMAAKGRNKPRAKLNETQVREIRSKYSRTLRNGKALAREYGISHNTLYALLNGKSWRGVA